MLTGHPDTDTNILLGLNLQDLRRYCLTNTYSLNLCRTGSELVNKLKSSHDKVENVINLLNKKKYLIIQSEDYKFKNYYAIIDYIGDIKSDHNYLDFIENMDIKIAFIDIRYKQKYKDYIITFYEYINEEYYYVIKFNISIDKLRKYLLNLFYDKLLI